MIAIFPVVSYLGPLVVAILTGSFIIEKIFAIPGLGNEFVESVTNRDYTGIMGTTVFYSVLLLLSILLVDIVYGVIDTRTKIIGREKGDLFMCKIKIKQTDSEHNIFNKLDYEVKEGETTSD